MVKIDVYFFGYSRSDKEGRKSQYCVLRFCMEIAPCILHVLFDRYKCSGVEARNEEGSFPNCFSLDGVRCDAISHDWNIG